MVKYCVELYVDQQDRRHAALELKAKRYSLLNTVGHEIRLVAIMPGSLSDPIECALKPISLNNRVHFITYEALSYTWGSPLGVRSILLNGEPFCVRTNLYNALKQLRLGDKVRFMWIDAISINQFDKVEKNRQVAIMRYIYRKSCEVSVWLGEADKTSALAFEFFELAEKQHDSDSFIKASIGNDKYQLHWQSIRILFKRDYWKRVWIIQEIATGPSITVQCGSDIVRWRTLVMCDAVWKALAPSSISRFPSWFRAVDKGERGPSRVLSSSDGPSNLDTIRKNFQNFQSHYPRPNNLVELITDSSDSPRNTIMELIQSSSTFKATDPRDYIYALLGLASDCQNLEFEIDYLLEPEEVYQRLVECLEEKTGRIDLLAFSGEANIFEDWKRENDSWLPSRASAVHSKLQISRININDRFMADEGCRKPFIKFQPAGYISTRRTLVSGCSVGTLWKLGPRFKNQSSSYFTEKDLNRVTKDIKEAYRFAKSILVDFEGLSSVISSRIRRNLQNFWRVLVCDRTIEGFQAPNDWEAMFIAIVENSPISDYQDFVRPYQHAVLYYMNNRQLFVTENWDFGVGPLDITTTHEEDRDDILVLLGCNVPMARKKYWVNTSLRGQANYRRRRDLDRLSSWAYLQNYMAGEVAEEIERNMKKIEVFSFM